MTRFSSILSALFVLALASAQAAPTAAKAPKAPTAPNRESFLEQHCYDCHDESDAKGDFRLDNLKFEPTNPANAKQWIRVIERLEDHEMPPRKKTQPTAKETSAFLAPLMRDLETAEVARQKREGRTVLRRLNRNEYQNTMHDLLGVDVDLKGILPEDTTAFGFDNIGEALSLSSVLMERYLMAADAALDSIFVKGAQPESKHWHVTMMPKNIQHPKDKLDFRLARGVRVLPDETLIFFSSGSHACDKFDAPVEGYYKFKVHTYTVDNGGQPLTLEIYGGSFDTRSLNTHVVGFWDIPEKPTDIEFTEYLPKRGTIRPQPYRIGQHTLGTQELVDAYKGKGIAVAWIEVDGPLIESWPPVGYENLLGAVPLEKAGLPEAEKAVKWLAARAFRRAIVDADTAPYIGLVKEALDAGRPFEEALRSGLKGVLCSPDFLYFRESATAFDNFALASRLSYFLWSSAPDDTLLGLALQGKLRTPAVLHAQVERMLKDPKGARFTDNFTGQWLNLRNIEFTTPDKNLYPEHDDALQVAMLRETKLFFDEILKKDLSISNFVQSDFTMLNERLAQHYGIEGVAGQEFRRVALKPEYNRGGLLTQAAILKVTANGTSTSPVIRGNWVLKNIIGKPVKPPPPNTPAIEPDIRGAKTIREQLTKHREVESCAVCHDRMDPYGFALESYDVVGGWRANYRSLGQGQFVKAEVEGRKVGYKAGPAVDPSGVLPDGRTFPDLAGLKTYLLQEKPQVARCIAEKLLTYSTGAGITFADRPAVDEVVKTASAHDYGLRSLIHAVVQSPAFLSK